MEVKITSQEIIKPFLPTPQHLRIFKPSFLDQLVSAAYAPFILFYPANSGPDPGLDVQLKLELLKRSPARTLARIYPLAGKIRDGPYIECDDEGARFVEAIVNVSLPQFLANPDLILLNTLIPCEHRSGSLQLTHLTNIQVNVFQCGGLAVGICNSHKLHDGTALGLFMKEWAAFARECGDSSTSIGVAQDLIVAAEVFPANDMWLRDWAVIAWRSMYRTGNCATRRFLFSRTAIEALKARGMGSNVENPTRIEAVSRFLWKCMMTAFARKNNGLGRPSTFTHMVNVRKRMNPPLPELSLGNLIWMAVAHCENTRGATSEHRIDDSFLSLVVELRGAISKVDGDFLLGLSRDKSLISSTLEGITGVGSSDKVDHIVCSSWCKFGLYDADFGWGRPSWVSQVGLPGPAFVNIITLIGTRSGDGIEAWITLDESEMAILQEDPDLRSFTSVNPSPLSIGNKP